MRALFLVLLVLNLTFALWHIVMGGGIPSNEDAGSAQGPTFVDAPLLRLVGDVVGISPSENTLDVGVEPLFQPNDQCWQIGPFDGLQEVENARTRLAARAVTMAIRELSVPVAPDYWVYVSPRANRQAAMLLLRQLQARDIESSIIAEGELENGISLGFFSSEKSARLLLERHQGQLYQVDLKIVPREITEFWGLIALNEYPKLGSSGWQRFRDEIGGVIMKQNICDVVATNDNFE